MVFDCIVYIFIKNDDTKQHNCLKKYYRFLYTRYNRKPFQMTVDTHFCIEEAKNKRRNIFCDK